MTAITASVIVVSRQRPEALKRCLNSVSQILYHPFEVIVVADAAGCSAANELPFSDRIRVVEFEEQNISLARNQGLMQASGDVMIFIDDDAVAEPGWLDHLLAPFADPDVVASGGFVRGRNGISYQWRGQIIDSLGFSANIPLQGDGPRVVPVKAGTALNIVGTNCAYRRDSLAAIGGFDPAFRYFLDEADVNMRLAAAGGQAAIVPLAEVHHGFAPSDRRHTNRMPKTLFDVGASHAVFLRKHAHPADHIGSISRFSGSQRASLLRHMVAGRCEPREVREVLQSLEAGLAAGFERPLEPLGPLAGSERRFQAFHPTTKRPQHHILSGYRTRSRQLREDATRLADKGDIVSLYLFSRTALFHQVRYDKRMWEQSGGLFGKSERTDPLFRLTSFGNRLKRETNRSASQRYPAN